MPTGACGINCDMCRLKVMGICSSCGSGISSEAVAKIEAQKNILGQPCPILACAQMNRIQYCLMDCRMFPCENFSNGPYPFSEGFLQMQKRRRSQSPSVKGPNRESIEVPKEYWDELKGKDIDKLCHRVQGEPFSVNQITIPFLKTSLLVDIENQQISIYKNDQWEVTQNRLLDLLTLVYLLNVEAIPLKNQMVSVKELKTAHFFQGPHRLKTDLVLDRYGNDIEGFKTSAKALGGISQNMADAAFMFFPFPRIPIYFLLWAGDEDFKPNLTVCFDKTIERHLTADAIWGLVTLVSDILVLGV